MIRPKNSSKSPVNSSSKTDNSTDFFPRSILRKREKRYNNVANNRLLPPPAASAKSDTYTGHPIGAAGIKRLSRSYEEEEEESSSKLLILNENEDILIQRTCSSAVFRGKVCGAQFPLVDKNSSNILIRDLNNNEFLEDSHSTLIDGDDDTATASGSKVRFESKSLFKDDDALDDPLTLRLQEGLHSNSQEINPSGGVENDKAHSSSSALASAKKTSNEKKVKQLRKGVLALPVKTNLPLPHTMSSYSFHASPLPKAEPRKISLLPHTHISLLYL